MREYTIPENTDVTKYYLKKVLEQKAPALGRLNKAFADINIDRVLQSFIDIAMEDPIKLKTPEEYAFLAGQLDMSRKLKRFLCNLNNISIAVEDGSLDLDELGIDSIISGNDIQRAQELSKGK